MLEPCARCGKEVDASTLQKRPENCHQNFCPSCNRLVDMAIAIDKIIYDFCKWNGKDNE